jgi:hypothetical protein
MERRVGCPHGFPKVSCGGGTLQNPLRGRMKDGYCGFLGVWVAESHLAARFSKVGWEGKVTEPATRTSNIGLLLIVLGMVMFAAAFPVMLAVSFKVGVWLIFGIPMIAAGFGLKLTSIFWGER